MKKFLAVFLVLFQAVFCIDPNENNSKAVTTTWINCDDSLKLNLIIHRDSRMPIAIASVVFKVGKIDVPESKSGIDEIIAKHLISRKLHEEFLRSGIDCYAQCSDECTEICAVMNPKNVKRFFKLLEKINDSIDINVADLELCKQIILIENKLRSCNESNAVSNNMRAQAIPHTVFNESSLKSITIDDVKDFYEQHYKNGVVLITICGDVDWNPTQAEKRRLANIYHSDEKISDIPYRIGINERIKPNIHIANKHMRNSVNYSYLISEDTDKQLAHVFSYVVLDGLFRDFCKARSVLDNFRAEFSLDRDDSIFSVSLFPKKDVSLKEIKKLYGLFVKKITNVAVQQEVLDKITRKEKISFDVLLCDLYNVHSYIRNAYLSGTYNTRFYPSYIIERTSSEDLRKLAEKILNNKLISTITTQYRSDK